MHQDEMIGQLEAALEQRGVTLMPLTRSRVPDGASKDLKKATRLYGDAFWEYEMGQRGSARCTAEKARAMIA